MVEDEGKLVDLNAAITVMVESNKAAAVMKEVTIIILMTKNIRNLTPAVQISMLKAMMEPASGMQASVASSIRSSRRRLKTGSAVVLNTDRLQKCMSSDTHAQQSSIDAPLNDVDVDDQENKDINCSILLSNQTSADPIISEVSLCHDKPQTSEAVSRKHQEISEQLKHLKQQLKGACSSPDSNLARNRSATIIQRKWVQFKSLKNKLRYTQHGKWTSRQSDMVFALVLGYRARYLLKSLAADLNIKAQRDVIQLLSDMYFSSVGKGVQYKWEFIDKLLRKNDETVDDLLVLNPSLSHSDLMLAKSLSKQLLLERQRFHRLLFQCCTWVPTGGPSAGYWDLSVPILDALTATKNSSSRRSSNVFSPSRKLPRSPTKYDAETPPSLRLAMNHAKQASKLQPLNLYANKHRHHHSVSAVDAAAMRPFPMKDFPVAVTTSSDAGIEDSCSGHQRERSVPGIMTPECGRDARRTATTTTDSGGALKRSSAAQLTVGSMLRSARCRSSDSKGHVQLDVLSAERLMSAKKGAMTSADRIPCLRVKLMLPPWSHADTALRKVQQETRDFHTTTLNPQFDTSFSLILPCNRAILNSIILAAGEESIGGSSCSELTDTLYNLICRALLQWWSQGSILIEVFDGERFNTEIFMGHVELLLSGFMVAIKKADDLEMKGSFQLCKSKPTDRVSGSVKLHAYLHVPSRSYISELLGLSGSASAASVSDLSSRKDDSPVSPADAAAEEVVIDDKLTKMYSSNFMKSLLAHKSHLEHGDTIIREEEPVDSGQSWQPKLEESENFRFYPKQLRSINRKYKSSTKSSDTNSVVVGSSSKPPSPHVPSSSSSSSSSIVGRKEHSIDASAMRRHSIVDITRRLDGLSAVQRRADEAIDQLNQKLQARSHPPSMVTSTHPVDRPDSALSPEDRDHPEMSDDTDSNSDASSTYYECNLSGDFKDGGGRDGLSRGAEMTATAAAAIGGEGEFFIHRQAYNHNDSGGHYDSSSAINPQNVFKVRTIYHSTEDDCKAESSSSNSSLIRNISLLDECNPMNGFDAASDDFDELIVLSQTRVDDEDSLSDAELVQSHGTLFQVRRSSSKPSPASSPSPDRQMYDEYVPTKRKPHEKLPYEEDDCDGYAESAAVVTGSNDGVCRVVLALRDVDML